MLFRSQKVSYLRDLCVQVANGLLPLDTLDCMPDEEVIAALTRVKGIGRWTAEMFLMFSLLRPNVLPVDDLGLRRAAGRHYFGREDVGADELRALGAQWEPWRSVATWYLWRSLDPVPVEY